MSLGYHVQPQRGALSEEQPIRGQTGANGILHLAIPEDDDLAKRQEQSAKSLMLALMSQDPGFPPWETSAPQLPSDHPSDATIAADAPHSDLEREDRLIRRARATG